MSRQSARCASSFTLYALTFLQVRRLRELAQALGAALDRPRELEFRAFLENRDQLLQLGTRNRARQCNPTGMKEVLPFFPRFLLHLFRNLAESGVSQFAPGQHLRD